MYDAVLKMRQPGGVASNAAVDTMGCERLADQDASPRDRRFHTLVSLMLSSQTKDTVNAVVMAKLKKELPPYEEGAPPGLNLENMLAVEPALLNEFIWAVGFHNNKTKCVSLSLLLLLLDAVPGTGLLFTRRLTRCLPRRYLKQTAEILRDKWNGDIPDTISGLTSLPGVGPKMAHLCMSVAWNRTEGIGVDVHVHRITNLWGWHKTRNPEETRLALQSWLPRDRWRPINWLLVGFGQTVCLPVGRKCGQCELGLGGLCKAADRGKVAEGRKARARLGVKVEKVEAKIKIDEGDEEAKDVVKGELGGVKEEEEEEIKDGKINGAMVHRVKVEASDDDVKENLASLRDVKPAGAAEEQITEGRRATRRRKR
jgi:endonuclease-3